MDAGCKAFSSTVTGEDDIMIGTPKSENKSAEGEKSLLLAILLLAFALRIIRLGTFPFWADEVYSLVLSQDLPGIFFHGRFISNHPPMAYFLLALWRMLGMWQNEWTIRLLPAIFGVLGVGSIYWLAKQLFNARVGLVTAFILAIAPFHIWHSQDLKEYIYLPFAATLMVGFFYRGVVYNRRRDWFFYGLSAGLCCYTEIFVVPLLLTINCWFLCIARSHRACIKGWFLSNLMGAAMFLPWLGIMLQKIQDYMLNADHWWIPHPNFWSVVFYFKTVAFGYTALKPWFYLSILCFGVLTLLGVWQAWRKKRYAATLLVAWAVMPVLLVFCMSFISQSIFLIRAMIPFSIAVYLLAGVGMASIKNTKVFITSMGMVVLLCTIGLVGYYSRELHPLQHPHRPGIHPPREYDKAAHYILDHLEEGDVVVHASLHTWPPFYWYGFQGIPQYVGGMDNAFVSIINSSNPINTNDEELLRLWPQVIDTIVPGHKRIWYVFAEWERAFLPGNAKNVWRWLDSRFMEVNQQHFNGIEVFLYRTDQHENFARKVLRDKDDGVTAMVRYAGSTETYQKIKPDIGLVPSSPEMRSGALRVQFEPIEVQEVQDVSEVCEVCFSIENTTSDTAECRINLLASDTVVACAAFNRTDPKSNTWNAVQFHNGSALPQTYDLTVLSADLNHGEASVTGTHFVNAGEYVPFIYTTFPWNSETYWLAPVEITIDNTVLDVDLQQSLTSPGTWNWVRGNPISLTDAKEIALKVTASPFSETQPGYANLAYIAFVKQAQLEKQTENTLVSESVTITGKETIRKCVTVPSVARRVDVWVFQKGEKGDAYHIFRESDALQ